MKTSGGFTLMEILVSMLVFSVVVSTVFLSHRSLFSSVGPMTDDLAVNSMAQVFLQRLSTDLSAVYALRPPQYAPPGFNAPPNPFRFVGTDASAGNERFPRLRFAAAAHVPLTEGPDRGIAEIVYFVTPEDEGGFTVRRADRLTVAAPETRSIPQPAVCRQLKSLTFTYFDAAGSAHDAWDSEDRSSGYSLPSSVGVRFTLGEKDTQRVFETRIALNVFREPVS